MTPALNTRFVGPFGHGLSEEITDAALDHPKLRAALKRFLLGDTEQDRMGSEIQCVLSNIYEELTAPEEDACFAAKVVREGA